MKRIISIALAFLLMLSVTAIVPNAATLEMKKHEFLKAGSSAVNRGNFKLPEKSGNKAMLKDASGIYSYEIDDDMAYIYQVSTAAKGSVKIPETLSGYPVVCIIWEAFSGCNNVTDVTLPANMIYVYPDAFYNSGVKNIYVNANNEYYTSINGVLFSKDKTVLCAYPNAKGKSYNIPAGTQIIDAYAFIATDIESVTLPNTLTEIYDEAFAVCKNLKSIRFPDSLTAISYYAFAECTSLTGITFSKNMKVIPEGAFAGCTALTKVSIPDNITTIETDAFIDCIALVQIGIGKGVNSIQLDAFTSCCKLQNIKVAASNTVFCDIDGVLFSKNKEILYLYPIGKKATRYNVPPTTKEIKAYAFTRCGFLCPLTHISVPEGVTTIENNVFEGATVQRIYIPESAKIASTIFDNENEDIDVYGIYGSYAYSNVRDKIYDFIPVDFERIAGSSRYDTAVQISDKAWNSADTVILANGLNYADALAGVSLGGKFDAPILLTAGKASLEPEVLAQIEKLAPSKIILLGGAGAISEAIENSLGENYEVVRLAGLDRYETALEIGKYLRQVPETAIIVTGRGYADSLSISPIAAKFNYPIIYADPVKGLTDEALEYVSYAQNIIIIGGTGVVTEVTENQLSGKNIERIFGTNRYLTSYAVADRFRDSFGDDVMIATGMNFPDALAGGVLAAKLGTPLLLTHDMGMIDEMKSYVDERTPDNIYVLGGEGAVPSLVPAELYH